MVGISGNDVVLESAARLASRNGGLADSVTGRAGFAGPEHKPGRPRRPAVAVAVRAVHLQVGPRAILDRAGRGIVPHRQPRCLRGIRRAGQPPEPREMRQLVLSSADAVQVARLGPEQAHHAVARVTLLALVEVGHQVIGGDALPALVEPGDLLHTPGQAE